MILFRNGTWQTQLWSRDAPASQDSGANCAILLPSAPRLINATTTTGCTIITSHPAACLSLAVTHSCTNTRCTRQQRLSNLNRTSAFVCGSLNHHRCVCAPPFLLLNQRDGEEQQVAATLHKYLHISKGQTVQPGEIHRLEAEQRASGFCLCARCNHQRAHGEHGRATPVNCWLMVDT